MLDASLRQIGLVRAPARTRRLQRRLCRLQGVGRAVLRLDGAIEFGPQVGGLDVETGQHRGGPIALGGGVLEGRGERGHRVDHRVDVGAGRSTACSATSMAGLRRGVGGRGGP